MIQHTWYDRLTDKYFWRQKMSDVGCQVPGAIANWDGNKLTMVKGHPLSIKRAMLKIPDSYLGIGDKIMDDLKFDE